MNECSQTEKEPWLAVNLSYFFAGIGQLYAGNTLRGIFLIVLLSAVSTLGFWQIFAPSGNVIFGAGFLIAGGILYIWNLFDAYEFARRGNPVEFEEMRKKNRDPWLAVFFTQIVPGAGHIYLRKTYPGFLFIGIYAVLYAFQQLSIFLGFAAVALSVIAALHAYFQSPVRREPTSKPIMILLTVMVIYGITTKVVPFYVESNLIRNFTTSSGYMAPAIHEGDRFFVRQLPADKYSRGDVLVFEMPGDTTWIYLRRLIAFEGEKVEIREDSSVYVDNRLLSLPGDQVTTIPDGDYAVPGQPYIVPEDHLFLLAERPEEGEDSRHFGGVAQENLIGHAYKIYWPLYRAGPVE